MAVSVLSDFKEAFERDGFVNGGAVVDPDGLFELRQEVERFADVQFRGRTAQAPMPKFEENTGPGQHYKMSELRLCSPVFEQLTENGQLLKLAGELMGTSDLRVWADTVQYKPPLRGGSFHWHQDGPYHMAIDPARVLSAWVALDDADEECGCMWMVPGSYRWGDREAYLGENFRHLRERDELCAVHLPPDVAPSEWRAPVPCPARAGEVHFHHAYTWHASPMNKSPRVRRAFTIFYLAIDS